MFSCPDRRDLPADLVAFKSAYREPEGSIETRHLKLYAGYLQDFKKEHERLVMEKMIRATTLTGTKDEVLDATRAMQKAGIKQVAVQPVTDARAVIRRIQ